MLFYEEMACFTIEMSGAKKENLHFCTNFIIVIAKNYKKDALAIGVK